MLADPEIYKTDLDKATALQLRLTELDLALIAALERWESLESKKTT
jgi:hypothetical protein